MKSSLLRGLLAAVVIAFTASAADAQLRYGFNFGGSFAKSSLSNAPGFSEVNRSGFRGGLILEYQLPKCGLAFDASVNYMRYNARVRENATASITDPGRNFIEVPLNIKYKFWMARFSDLFAPMIMTGPSFMINLDKQPDNALLTQKRFQPGWNVGVGFDIINFIELSAGYRFGLGNSIKHFAAAPVASLHTNGWYLTATLLFDF